MATHAVSLRPSPTTQLTRNVSPTATLPLHSSPIPISHNIATRVDRPVGNVKRSCGKEWRDTRFPHSLCNVHQVAVTLRIAAAQPGSDAACAHVTIEYQPAAGNKDQATAKQQEDLQLWQLPGRFTDCDEAGHPSQSAPYRERKQPEDRPKGARPNAP